MFINKRNQIWRIGAGGYYARNKPAIGFTFLDDCTVNCQLFDAISTLFPQ